jgi:hypothetical protein
MELAPFPLFSVVCHPDLLCHPEPVCRQAGLPKDEKDEKTIKSSGEVVKASSGHYPLPFLISTLKNCCKYTIVR